MDSFDIERWFELNFRLDFMTANHKQFIYSQLYWSQNMVCCIGRMSCRFDPEFCFRKSWKMDEQWTVLLQMFGRNCCLCQRLCLVKNPWTLFGTNQVNSEQIPTRNFYFLLLESNSMVFHLDKWLHCFSKTFQGLGKADGLTFCMYVARSVTVMEFTSKTCFSILSSQPDEQLDAIEYWQPA